METFRFLLDAAWVAPGLLAAILFGFRTPSEVRTKSLFFALLLVCYGAYGLVGAIRIVIEYTPLRPVMLVPRDYVVLTQNFVMILHLAVAIVVAVRFSRSQLIPRWTASAAPQTERPSV